MSDGKNCTKCGTFYPPQGFYLDKRSNKLASWCKFCQRKRALDWRYRDGNHDKVLAYMAERRKTPEELERNRKQARKSQRRFPEKSQARLLAKRAVRDGKLARLPCVKCGDPNTHAHHLDYSRPLDVEWLCKTCHGHEHRTSAQGLAALVKR